MDAVAALKAIQERLNEPDATERIPTHILADLDQILAEYPSMSSSPVVEPEYWEVLGGMGGRRVACDLPSRAEAEEVAERFARRMARLDVPQSRTWVERQSHRYGAA